MLLAVMSEESYVVRIYRKEARAIAVRRAGNASAVGATNAVSRRRAHDRTVLAGTVEVVEYGERQYFRDIEELWAILSGMSSRQADMAKPKRHRP
jgi:hypothetical protein